MYVLTGCVQSGLGQGNGLSPQSQHKKSLVTSAGIWVITKQSLLQEQAMTTEVLSPVFPPHKPSVHRSYPPVSCLQHRGDRPWCQRAQHRSLLLPGSQHHPSGVNCRAPAGLLALQLAPNAAIAHQCSPVLLTAAEAEPSPPASAALRTTWNPSSPQIPAGLFIPSDSQSKELPSRVIPNKRHAANLPQKLL